ncbi:non-specific lipid-transfer protein [Citrus sinensis]|uniref:Non-specific lipid-transfer protein n=1 Tax=Citrus clementina TaxID=85681 RepID=V4SUY3_CITCL|nr:non-specific lipid-transfer protein [Citrus x clementina]XP_006481183.1 non-specific lipid-transfer protein-like [Citrus sinensis]ESR42810.1 hypothetical protein CICLE_v10013139mg [Citrus x clementina]KAH9673338.1 non-specific lipid-transfer protein [Citrus sinensis]GAY32242.1 hypothetical protein CUMW_001320 [Citrus unshiu]
MALKLACAVLLMCMVMGAPIAQAAVTCGQVTSSLQACMPYVTGPGGGAVPPACCSGIKSLNSAATTTPDRQSVCNCLKTAAGSIRNLNLNLASGLPRQCGVNIPYQISPSVDCSRVR